MFSEQLKKINAEIGIEGRLCKVRLLSIVEDRANLVRKGCDMTVRMWIILKKSWILTFSRQEQPRSLTGWSGWKKEVHCR